jgi:hypothetical protein
LQPRYSRFERYWSLQTFRSGFVTPTGIGADEETALPRKQTRLVQAWIELYQESLMIDWNLAVTGQEPLRIEPLR